MTAPADQTTLEALEFDALKRLLDPHVRTPSGRRCLAELAPSADPADVAVRHALAAEAMRHHVEVGRLGPGGLDDPDPILQRLRPEGAVLDGVEISRLLGVLRAAASA